MSRSIEFREILPKTRRQKTQRFVLGREKEDSREGCFDRTRREEVGHAKFDLMFP
jgi:acyl-coenzyme A synthetase/AMP-(fatty) acid ligase